MQRTVRVRHDELLAVRRQSDQSARRQGRVLQSLDLMKLFARRHIPDDDRSLMNRNEGFAVAREIQRSHVGALRMNQRLLFDSRGDIDEANDTIVAAPNQRLAVGAKVNLSG